MQVTDHVLTEGCRRFGASDPKSLGGSESALYQVQIGGARHMLRFSPVAENERGRFAARWDFVDYLSDHDVHVPERTRSGAGSRTEWVRDESTGTAWALVCVRWIEGSGLDPRSLAKTDPSVLQAWGALMGRMHAATKTLPHDLRLGGWRQEASSFHSSCKEPAIRDRWQEAIDALDSMNTGDESYGLVHNDLHYANIIVNGSGVWVVDFDVCCYHWFACDIAIAMQGVLWTEPSATVVDSHSWFGVFDQFMTGYKRETDLDARWEAMVPSFLSYRRLLLYTVFSQEWKRPNAWHAARLRAWRRGIVEGVPVVGWRER